MSRRIKYFVVVEGKDRGILRNKWSDAKKKKQILKKYNPGKKVHIFAAQKVRDED